MLLRNIRNNRVLIKRLISTSRCNNGYIVLVPEIGENFEKKGLAKPDGLIEFNNLTIESCLAVIGDQARTVEKTVKDCEEAISKDENLDPVKDVFHRLEESIGPLETTWGVAKTLYLGRSTLMPTKYYLNIHERAQRARAARFNSEIIFNKLSSTDLKPKENLEENRLISKYLLEGKLNGLSISAENRQQLSQVLNDLQTERQTFRNKTETAKKQFVHTIKDYSLVRSFPPNLLELITVNENEPTKGPWKLNLQTEVIKGFLEYCPDRNQRWNIWQADTRKASTHGDKNLSNSTHLESIRALRKRQANLLGFPDYATMSMETKMLKSVKNVLDVVDGLLAYALPAQVKEIERLQKFAVESGFEYKIEPCDVYYWKRKHLKYLYNFDEETLKEYFSLPRVLTALFHIAEKIFHIKIVEGENVETWHPSVKYFNLYDASDSSNPLGGFYLDCYSREGNKGLLTENKGWMVGMRNKSGITNMKPLCALIFNFHTPDYGKTCLLSLNDLEAVFYKFGNCLQHLLTQSKYSDLAGLSNIEWDASEACGNVMLHLLYNTSVLQKISGHYSTEEPITQEAAENIKRYHNYLAGYELCEQLYLTNLDLELYSSTEFWVDIVKKLWPKYITFPLDKKNSHVCSMTEIVSGNWAAAYFSHIYSRVIAADVYSAFLEENFEEVGMRLRNTFFSSGGAVPTAEIFRRFRGRDPSSHALIESLELNGETD